MLGEYAAEAGLELIGIKKLNEYLVKRPDAAEDSK